jgi:hypothetical protein
VTPHRSKSTSARQAPASTGQTKAAGGPDCRCSSERYLGGAAARLTVLWLTLSRPATSLCVFPKLVVHTDNCGRDIADLTPAAFKRLKATPEGVPPDGSTSRNRP